MTTLSPQIQRCYDLAIKDAWKHPFFLIPLGHCEWHEGNPETTPTMQVAPVIVKGKPEIHLWINPDWVSGLPDDEVFGVLCHEIMHPMLRHHERIGGKQYEEWAQAADMVINSALTQSAIKLPKTALMPPAGYEDSPAEEIYDLLVQQKIPRPKNYKPGHVGQGCMPQPSDSGGEPGQVPSVPSEGDSPGSGEGEGSAPSTSTTGDSNDSNRAWGEMIAQAQSYSRGTGVAKVMAKVFAPKPTKTRWARLMRQVANRAQARGGRDLQTFAKTHRRSSQSDFIMPGWQSTAPAIAVLLDTSGSVSDEMLRSSLSSVIEIARTTSIRIFLALHDGECYFAGWIKPETTVEYLSSLCGQRGGTDPEGAFEAVGQARARFDVGVYLTDGEVGEYPDKPVNIKRMIVGIVGDSRCRSTIPGGWQEVLVEIDA